MYKVFFNDQRKWANRKFKTYEMARSEVRKFIRNNLTKFMNKGIYGHINKYDNPHTTTFGFKIVRG